MKDVTGEQYTYLAFDGKYYKIGKSINPEKRIKTLKTGNANIQLITYGKKIKEADMHLLMANYRVDGEWFDLNEDNVNKTIAFITIGKHTPDTKLSGIFSRKSTEQKIQMAKGRQRAAKKEDKLVLTYTEYTLAFGKYKGRQLSTLIDSIEMDYCQWYLTVVDKTTIAYKYFYYHIYNRFPKK